TQVGSRAERILNAVLQIIELIQEYESIKAFFMGCGGLLAVLFTRVSKPPMEFRPTETMLKLWLQWKKKAEQLLLPKYQWITWLAYMPVLRPCAEYARQKFFQEHKGTDGWIHTISAHIVDKANAGLLDAAENLYNAIIIMTSSNHAVQMLNYKFNKGEFISKEAQDWVLTHTVGERVPDSAIERDKKVQDQFAEVLYHPREKEIALEVARLLLLGKERESSLYEASRDFEELVSFYDPIRFESVQNLKSFLELLKSNFEGLRMLLGLEYFGIVGRIEEYNPNRHQLTENIVPAPSYIEIVHSGVARRQKDKPIEILQKALVKPATGG
ncbi:MAG: hypothetical protein ACFFCW_40755, partial [Candidatus Hodarchaeota archaeon]